MTDAPQSIGTTPPEKGPRLVCWTWNEPIGRASLMRRQLVRMVRANAARPPIDAARAVGRKVRRQLDGDWGRAVILPQNWGAPYEPDVPDLMVSGGAVWWQAWTRTFVDALEAEESPLAIVFDREGSRGTDAERHAREMLMEVAAYRVVREVFSGMTDVGNYGNTSEAGGWAIADVLQMPTLYRAYELDRLQEKLRLVDRSAGELVPWIPTPGFVMRDGSTLSPFDFGALLDLAVKAGARRVVLWGDRGYETGVTWDHVAEHVRRWK